MSTDKSKQALNIINYFFGGFLVLLGLFLAFRHSINWVTIVNMWPLLMIIPGGILFLSSFVPAQEENGQFVHLYLFPFISIILILLGIYFLWLNHYGWQCFLYTWPVVLLIPGIACLFMFCTAKNNWLLLPGLLTIALALLLYEFLTPSPDQFSEQIRNTISNMMIPAGLVLMGLLLFFARFKDRQEN